MSISVPRASVTKISSGYSVIITDEVQHILFIPFENLKENEYESDTENKNDSIKLKIPVVTFDNYKISDKVFEIAVSKSS